MLETERLYLRELNPEIYAQLLTSRSDSELMAYFGFQAKEALEEEKERFRQGFVTYFISFHNFHLLDKKTEQVIGKCGFHTWIPTHRRAEVGYQLFHDQHKGKGLMTEALGAVLSYGFEQMNLYRVEAFIADYNVPSHRLLQHSGFSEEGVVRGHYIVDGVNEDSLLLSLLRPEYEKLKASLFAQGEQV
ncbi:ribosomal-protein-alanine N-acetyltransferase [Pontibacter ummariensis]|uniref:Ribosomal-protein-alanine N-acetyltransferase n=2 Tax=Pontibacter ummariensis TaxID=1610492 RepID=A0A239D6U8_9BACT|nr:ribosomal-protein-alanine N-acetyltransferase [Pontibacter ummariensis]SNS27581.1 ribosomal-protein-alanine N-acetyltransferase [Pontibacter ummariensis]